MQQYLLIFLSALAIECLNIWWTQAVASHRFWLSLLISTLNESLSWLVFIMSITTDLSLCPFAIAGNTIGAAIAMTVSQRRI
jgi:hypothetical protein